MKCDVILSGVGGQGVLSVAAIIAQAAVDDGFAVRQSEVHGMAQRGGAVLAHLRLSDGVISSDLVPRGEADLVLSMEPMESLRHIEWLSPKGALVTAADPMVNIPNYPDLQGILDAIKTLPKSRIVDAASLAKEAGLIKAVNMVMVGAASPFLPIKPETMEKTIEKMFANKDAATIDANKKAYNFGKNAAK